MCATLVPCLVRAGDLHDREGGGRLKSVRGSLQSLLLHWLRVRICSGRSPGKHSWRGPSVICMKNPRGHSPINTPQSQKWPPPPAAAAWVHEVISQTDSWIPRRASSDVFRGNVRKRPLPEPRDREGGLLGNGERRIRMPACRPPVAATRLVAAITGCPALPATPSPGASEALTTGDCRVLEQTPRW